ncbi:tRNA (adenine(22)-N(1))-methyltransferase TrmK [Bacillus aquiflavi]|uniref:tRNA (adenine(22)-N(1))-methyltransferase n=1 Tax=Bacillus aquiflavi TaxID=2672567 RepID=UPI001CA8FDCB|nr:tRNA (adenine(22)-N(1))-methyltransferase TrmK [Bacillus aquiflavi]UAC47279.1 tRNA (adenine(22)-N(1))-methyltransferase TrmK [Bacillus aquiflavi]
MNTEKLSARLAAVAKYIPKGARLADIGSDHAYLPCYAVKEEIVPFAIAGEIADGPFLSAKKQVENEGLTQKISVRKGDGLAVIERGEVDCITIAGMGGTLIINILDHNKEKLQEVQRVILQPNIGARYIRKWFLENGWELITEEILQEDGKVYEILIGEKGNPYKPYEQMLDSGLLLGPFLQVEKNEAFKQKWTNELITWRNVLAQLDKATTETDELLQKKQQLHHYIKLAEEALNK